MIEKDFTPYQESLELKALGFDEPTLYHWHNSCKTHPFTNEIFNPNCKPKTNSGIKDIGEENYVWSAPTFSQAFRWFREKHNWQNSIDPTADQHSRQLGYNHWIWNYKTGEEYHTMPKNRPTGDWEYENYEEAELACLKKLIQIVKEKQ